MSAATSSIDADQVKRKALALGFHKVGIANVNLPDDKAAIPGDSNRKFLQSWLAEGRHAQMEWMNNPKRQDVRQIMPGVRSLICVALNYYTDHVRPDESDRAKISRYGWGRDYHRVMQSKLKALATWLKTIDPSIQACYYAILAQFRIRCGLSKPGWGGLLKTAT
jgi:epoxyqueuosine reductase